MREICLIGNSHVAALKLGLDHRLAEESIHHCRFSIFGSRAQKLQRARVRDGRVMPHPRQPEKTFDHQSGPHEYLDLDAFDEIYMTVGTRPDQFPHFNPWFILNYAGEMDQNLRLISQETISAIVDHTLNGQWFSRLVRQILNQSQRPILYFLGCPFWSTKDPRCQNLLEQLKHKDSTHLLHTLSRLQGEIAKVIQSRETERFRLPLPPKHLLDPTQTATLHRYCVDSVALSSDFDTKHKAQDYRHMNAEYGRAMIDWIVNGAD